MTPLISHQNMARFQLFTPTAPAAVSGGIITREANSHLDIGIALGDIASQPLSPCVLRTVGSAGCQVLYGKKALWSSECLNCCITQN